MIQLSKILTLKVLEADNNKVVRSSDDNKIEKMVKNLFKSKKSNYYTTLSRFNQYAIQTLIKWPSHLF